MLNSPLPSANISLGRIVDLEEHLKHSLQVYLSWQVLDIRVMIQNMGPYNFFQSFYEIVEVEYVKLSRYVVT